ncbi:DHA2 family efflux MFS transporter permease subunit [Actinocorallia populi]|uniref:DHA2 family efflux MFS transporter permease subunit n=1 Tax=Actinocorallia populi TaxID=2079200 RepID=UPI001E2A7490|nr:DHA2 family efflux MFS transporter permease subunit [Actinocorallia populi]
MDAAPSPAVTPSPRRWRGDPWAILLTLSLGFFMTLLDLTIVNIALPNMIDRLGASLDEVLWVVNGYTLVLAVLLITAGRLGDLRGQRRMFMLGVAVFTGASLLCGLAQEPWQLIAARLLQGLGAALLVPQTMALIIATFPADRRGAAMGIWGGVAGLATIAGPTVGGVLVSLLDWRWIFFVNVPIGILVLVLAPAVIPDVRYSREHRLDLPGVLLATLGLFFLAFALTEGERYGWNGVILGSFAASAAILCLFALQQARRQGAEPLVPFALFLRRNFTVLSLVGLTVSIGMVGMFLPISLYLQAVLGYPALKTGLLLAPCSVMGMVVAPAAGRLSDRIGGKRILMFGMLLYALGLTWLSLVLSLDAHWTVFLAPMTVAGLGTGCVFAPMATEAMREIPPALAGSASGVNNTVRQIGSVLGGTVAGAILQNRMASELRAGAVERSGELPGPLREDFVARLARAAEGGLAPGAQDATAAEGVPPQVGLLAEEVFGTALIDAVRPTQAFAVVSVLLGAAACLLVRPPRNGAPPRETASGGPG